MTEPTDHTTGQPNEPGGRSGDDERGSEVSDYTGEVPRVAPTDPATNPEGPVPSGFGDGDVADVDHGDDGAAGSSGREALTDEDIEIIIRERDQYKDAAIRLQADFENFRKRSNAQASADIDRATGRMAEAMLPVLDAAENAYVNHPDEVGPLFNALLGELRRQGLESFDLDGAAFDPNLAEAVAHEPGDGADVVVAEVLRSGYSWKGKTLRAAMVRTTDGTASEEQPHQATGEAEPDGSTEQED